MEGSSGQVRLVVSAVVDMREDPSAAVKAAALNAASCPNTASRRALLTAARGFNCRPLPPPPPLLLLLLLVVVQLLGYGLLLGSSQDCRELPGLLFLLLLLLFLLLSPSVSPAAADCCWCCCSCSGVGTNFMLRHLR
jgi:hypothetical protein